MCKKNIFFNPNPNPNPKANPNPNPKANPNPNPKAYPPQFYAAGLPEGLFLVAGTPGLERPTTLFFIFMDRFGGHADVLGPIESLFYKKK